MSVDGTGRGGLEDAPFTYRVDGSGVVFIAWRGRQVTVLKGDRARKFLLRMNDADAAGRQQVMARVTGNFKRGNER
jgi:hypothetical protein